MAAAMGLRLSARPEEATVMVAGPSSKELKRTPKLLIALNSGVKYVVGMDWFEDSARAGRPLPIPASLRSSYIIKDKDREKVWAFDLTKTLKRQRQHGSGVFAGLRFYVPYEAYEDPAQAKLPAAADMRAILESGGGQWLDKLPQGKAEGEGEGGEIIVVVTEEALAGAGAALVGRWRRAGRLLAAESIYVAVLRQQLDPKQGSL